MIAAGVLAALSGHMPRIHGCATLSADCSSACSPVGAQSSSLTCNAQIICLSRSPLVSYANDMALLCQSSTIK